MFSPRIMHGLMCLLVIIPALFYINHISKIGSSFEVCPNVSRELCNKDRARHDCYSMTLSLFLSYQDTICWFHMPCQLPGKYRLRN